MSTQLLRRDNSDSMAGTIYDLLVALLVLIVSGLLLVGALLLLRRRRIAVRSAATAAILPIYSEKRASACSTHSHHRRAAARSISPMQIYNEKERFFDAERGPRSPTGGIPEIRVTFPEEFDEAGKLQSGKVVLVRVNDSGIGLENVPESMSPRLPCDTKDFQSIDLERVGGLVEKPRRGLGWD